MNRWLTLILIGLAGLLASCGSSIRSSTQPGNHDEYSVVVTPDQFTLNAGDLARISATVELSNQNSTPRAISPQPTIRFSSSDPRVTIDPGGEVCAGQWDVSYLFCAQTVFPQNSSNAGQLDLPTGYVTITAYDASHGVGSSTIVSIHPRATKITLDSPEWRSTPDSSGNQQSFVKCISQNQQVKYIATTFDANGKVANCSDGIVAGCVNDNDYTWSVGDPNVASVGTHGGVIAHNPGVTNVFATLNKVVSALAFATCPPASIVLQSSPFSKGVPLAPFSTADLSLNKGDQRYLTVTEVDDANGNPMVDTTNKLAPPITLPLTYISSDLLIGTFTKVLPLTDNFTATTSGRTTLMAACEPLTCNVSVPDFTSPAGHESAQQAGFGYPVYSNVIGVTVEGTTGSTVLVTGDFFADGSTKAFRLLAYDSESLAVTQTVALGNLPNSLVVAPNGAKAYVGSADGLVVVDLSTYRSSLGTYPVEGGNIGTDFVTGKVLGVSPDSRYVVISDTSDPNPANQLVFFIDTIGTRIAKRYPLPGIKAVTFAADGSNIWIGGDDGVYVFTSDTFKQTIDTTINGVNALAWVPDGQSYFASGNRVVDDSTCDDRNLQTPLIPAGSPLSLATTAIEGTPYVIGMSSGSLWLDYTVTSTSQIAASGHPVGPGFVCSSGVSVRASVPPVVSGLKCSAQQVTFSPRQEQAFVTGVDPNCTTPDSVIHGYDEGLHAEMFPPVTALSQIIPLSGGVLSDGRELYIGTWDKVAKTAALHRFNLLTTTGTQGTLAEDITPVSVELVPSFVAVVPK